MVAINYPFRCDECGKFFSIKDSQAISYVPYGSYLDEREPDELYICGKCWDKKVTTKKELIKSIAYGGIHQLFKEENNENN